METRGNILQSKKFLSNGFQPSIQFCQRSLVIFSLGSDALSANIRTSSRLHRQLDLLGTDVLQHQFLL